MYSGPFRPIFVGLLACMILGIYSCTETKPKLSVDKMTNLLLELHLAESYAQQIRIDTLGRSMPNQDSLRSMNAALLKKYQVSEGDVEQSLQWYSQQPELLDSMYQQMLSELAVMASKNDR
ncbi:MAG TPA: DUF4296 domain-containing protein [Chitinophagaceae bacterium]|nr:DUF4296 domain-containing protein [Chitinophagaceae bacterium]